VRQRPFPQCEAAVRQESHRTTRGSGLGLLTIDAFLFTSHILVLKTSWGKGNGMTTVGYARVSSTGQDLSVQLEKLAGCDKVFKEKRSGVDTGRPELKRCPFPFPRGVDGCQ
jgi:Resolvase, N terminal domain